MHYSRHSSSAVRTIARRFFHGDVAKIGGDAAHSGRSRRGQAFPRFTSPTATWPRQLPTTGRRPSRRPTPPHAESPSLHASPPPTTDQPPTDCDCSSPRVSSPPLHPSPHLHGSSSVPLPCGTQSTHAPHVHGHIAGRAPSARSKIKQSMIFPGGTYRRQSPCGAGPGRRGHQ